MGIYEKALAIQNQINTLKSNLGLSADTPLDEVVSTASSGGGGTPVKSNVYRVTTLAERDAIKDMVEDDMCVVADISESEVTEDTVTTSIKFKHEVTLDTQTFGDFITFVSDDYSISVEFFVDFSEAYMWYYTDTDLYEVNYYSEDGLTYILQSEIDTIPFESPVHVESVTSLDVIKKFLIIENKNFDGIFTYKDNSWAQTEIGATVTAEDLFAPKTAYSDKGMITGSLNKGKWSKRFIYLDTAEPEVPDNDSESLWIKPSTAVSLGDLDWLNEKTSDIQVTSTDITKKATVTLLGNNTYKFNVSGTCRTRGDYTYLERPVYLNINGQTPNYESKAVVYKDDIYVLSYEESLKRFVKFNMTTNTYTVLSTPSFPSGCTLRDTMSANVEYITTVYTYNNNIYLAVYNISGNTWAYHDLGAHTNETSFDFATIPFGKFEDACVIITSYGTSPEKFMKFRTVTYEGSIIDSFEILQSEVYGNIQPLKELLENFIYKHEDSLITTFDGVFELYLESFTDFDKTSFLNAFDTYLNPEISTYTNVIPYDVGYNDLLFSRDLTSPSYNVGKNGQTQQLLITGNANNSTLRPVYINNDTLYLLDSNNWTFYSMDLKQELPIVPGNHTILFQIGDSGHRVRLFEGVAIDVINVRLRTSKRNHDDTGVDDLYIRKYDNLTNKYKWEPLYLKK